MEDEMYVTKRNGNRELMSFDKILNRIKIAGINLKINYTPLALKVINQLFDGISATKIDELSAEQCASMSSIHPDYNILAGRIIISNHHKNTIGSFSTVMSQLYNYQDKHGKHSPLVSKDLYDFALLNSQIMDDLCDYDRDYLIDYFGFKTLEKSYLFKIDGLVKERPQHMWLRVAIGIHGTNIDRIKETYFYMSNKYFTHATPTLFNAGTPKPQLSSCYLLAMENDSIDGIYNTLKDCALISKFAGGIGLHIHNVRARGSHIRGTNGSSNGIVPMLRVFNNTAKYVDQCVYPTTAIYTTEGPIEIQNCTIGQTEIFNLTGGTEVIQNVLEHYYEGDILKIGTDFSRYDLEITPQHPIYILRDGESEPQWIEAGEARINDRIIYSIPKYEKEIENINDDDCRIYAYLLNYGRIENGIYEIDTDIPIDVEFIKNYLDSHLVSYELTDFQDDQYDTTFQRITWKPALQLPFRHNDFYSKKPNEKCIHQRWLNLPIHKIELLYSILQDYHVLKYAYTKKLQRQIQYLELRLAQKILPMLTEYVNAEKKLICTPIISIQRASYKGLLYDLQMKDEHNYLLENGLVHNGGGKRNGSFAIYLEPWHADISAFLEMRKNHGDEEMKARDLFYALWVPDLFMERIKADGQWTLMCPDECPGLADVYGDEFKVLYESYEKAGKGRETVRARDLWFQVLDAQMETGTPYLLYKDASNKKSNQKNVGTIKSSNLCTEIIEYSDDKESAVCNLASIALPTFIVKSDNVIIYDYKKLHEVTKTVTYNLNQIIDINYYPTEKTRRSNMRHRPIGIGVQGLADTFILLGHAFTSEEAKTINRNIFETIYHAALEASMEIAQKEGAYETFSGSPASQGVLQFDLWDINISSDRYDWKSLKTDIQTFGLRNSLLLAPMPTASTSQILGFNECIEPITSNIYSRRTNAGDFIIANKYLMNDLIKLELWNEDIKNNIIANNGSIQHIDIIPQAIKEKYKTVWELPMRNLIDMAADRGAFICQSQSLNLWLEDPTYSMLTSMHFYAWSKGLKTGIYYLRRRGKHQAQQFTIEPEKVKQNQEDDICEMCSS
jgi:ribonucleoside-diphosphate reductase alpha subunit